MNTNPFNLPQKSISLLSWILLFSLALIWGSSFILIKKGLIGLSSIQVGSLRIFSAFIFFLPFYLKGIKEVSKSKFKYILLSGITGNLLPAFLFAIAQTKIQSSITSVLNSLVPIFIFIISVFVFKEKFKKSQLVGVLIGFIGCFVLLTFKDSVVSFEINNYALYVVLATVCYGISANVIKYKLEDIKPIHISSLALLIVGPIAGVVFVNSGGVEAVLSTEVAYQSALYTILLGAVASVVGLVMFNKLIQVSPIIFASSVTYLIPIVAIIWGLLDGETLYLNHFIGIGIIFAGILLIKK